jgi:catechol 2,3-dioxygenase-like lactoylglutathione lyase family enzyme
VDIVRAKGGIITREPGPVKAGDSNIAVIKDPDGYKLELLERSPCPEPLCKVMLRVGDLDRSIKFYEKVRINTLYAGLYYQYTLCWFIFLFFPLQNVNLVCCVGCGFGTSSYTRRSRIQGTLTSFL